MPSLIWTNKSWKACNVIHIQNDTESMSSDLEASLAKPDLDQPVLEGVQCDSY